MIGKGIASPLPSEFEKPPALRPLNLKNASTPPFEIEIASTLPFEFEYSRAFRPFKLKMQACRLVRKIEGIPRFGFERSWPTPPPTPPLPRRCVVTSWPSSSSLQSDFEIRRPRSPAEGSSACFVTGGSRDLRIPGLRARVLCWEPWSSALSQTPRTPP